MTKYSFDLPVIQSQEDWERLLNKTWADAENFASHVEQLPESKLWEDSSERKYGNYYRNLTGVIEHCHYHPGQIVIIKQIKYDSEIIDKMMADFEINFLDHVAIRVKDLQVSAAWYEKVLGLKRYQLPEWGEFPVFMLSGKSGIALFPARTSDPVIDGNSRNVKIDHFAFNVNPENFEKAKKRFEDINLEFKFQDHYYFHSIYTHDPDGHTVELTTLMVPENSFYK